MEKLRSLEAPSVADGEEVGVDEKGWYEAGFLAGEGPEATSEVDVALGVGPERQTENYLGIDCLGVEGGRPGPQMVREAGRRQFAAE